MEIPHAKLLTYSFCHCPQRGFTWHIHEAIGNAGGRMGTRAVVPANAGDP
jgi:hypothetical protein